VFAAPRGSRACRSALQLCYVMHDLKTGRRCKADLALTCNGACKTLGRRPGPNGSSCADCAPSRVEKSISSMKGVGGKRQVYAVCDAFSRTYRGSLDCLYKRTSTRSLARRSRADFFRTEPVPAENSRLRLKSYRICCLGLSFAWRFLWNFQATPHFLVAMRDKTTGNVRVYTNRGGGDSP